MVGVDCSVLYELRGEIEVSMVSHLVKFVSEFEASRLEAVKDHGTTRKPKVGEISLLLLLLLTFFWQMRLGMLGKGKEKKEGM